MDIKKINVRELDRKGTSNNGKRGKYLTGYAYTFSENDLSLSKLCRLINVSAYEYYVYIPDNLCTEKNLVTHFYRMRKLRRVNCKYFICSCDLPSRMKLPCRHLMSVVGGYTIEMLPCVG